MRLLAIAMCPFVSFLLIGCQAEPVPAGRPTAGDDSPRDDSEVETPGANTGDTSASGAHDSNGGGTHSLFIVNYSSYDMCYAAGCDCNFDECGDDYSFYLESGFYMEYTGMPDGCSYLYVEDCDYGYYWENFVDIDGDFTWELYN